MSSSASEDAWLEETVGGLPCRVLLPNAYEPQLRSYPLVVSLHGSGERGTDNRAQLRNGVAVFEELRHEHPCIVRGAAITSGRDVGRELVWRRDGRPANARRARARAP